MPVIAGMLAAFTLSYTLYQFFPIPASYWTRRLEETFEEKEGETLPLWQLPVFLLSALVARYAPGNLLTSARRKLYWAHFVGEWTWIPDPAAFWALVVVCGSLGFGLGVLAFGSDVILAAASTALGAALPYVLVSGKASKAMKRIRRELPEVAQLLALEVAGGSSVSQALERVAEGRSLVSRWLTRVLQEARGRPLFSTGGSEGVLVEKARESGLPELLALAVQLDFIHRKGTSVKELLGALAVSVAAEYLAEVEKKAERLPNDLVIPAVIFFFIPFVITIMLPITWPLLEALAGG